VIPPVLCFVLPNSELSCKNIRPKGRRLEEKEKGLHSKGQT